VIVTARGFAITEMPNCFLGSIEEAYEVALVFFFLRFELSRKKTHVTSLQLFYLIINLSFPSDSTSISDQTRLPFTPSHFTLNKIMIFSTKENAC